MKAAFLSDIHANLPALEAALAATDQLGAERLFVAGDLVGDGPHPVEVIAALRGRGAECIRGNVDREVLKLAHGKKKLTKATRDRRKEKSNRAWTALRLREAPEELGWLAGLEPDLKVESEAGEILLVHGSPRGDSDYVYPSITPAGLASKLQPLGGYRPAVLVCGHSHIAFTREVDGVLVINCGSAGRPADGDPRGTLAILEVEGGAIRARMVRFAYSVDRLVADLRERDVPGIDPEDYQLAIKR